MPLAVIATGVSLLVPAGRHWWATSLFQQPASYTILYFNKPTSLPNTATFKKPVTFSFTVGNREGRVVDYRYVINNTAAGLTLKVAESSLRIDSGKTRTVTTAIRPSCITTPCEIQVTLPGHPETIDFIVTLKTGP